MKIVNNKDNTDRGKLKGDKENENERKENATEDIMKHGEVKQ